MRLTPLLFLILFLRSRNVGIVLEGLDCALNISLLLLFLPLVDSITQTSTPGSGSRLVFYYLSSNF